MHLSDTLLIELFQALHFINILEHTFYFVLEEKLVHLYGDSHVVESRKVPKYLRQECSKNASIKVEVTRVPGGELQQKEIEEIHQNARLEPSSYQVVLLGGNNIRGGKESVSSFVAKCFQLCKRFIGLPSPNLILCGMIPSLHSSSKAIFQHADEGLKRVADGFLNVTFLNLAPHFMIEGEIDKSLYSDKIHLKRKGSRILAKAIFNHISSWEKGIYLNFRLIFVKYLFNQIEIPIF